MLFDGISFFGVTDPKLESYRTNGSPGWCGDLCKYFAAIIVTLLTLLIVIFEAKLFGTVVSKTENYDLLVSDAY